MMPSNLIKNKTKYLILFLIAIQSILLALGAIFLQAHLIKKLGKTIIKMNIH